MNATDTLFPSGKEAPASPENREETQRFPEQVVAESFVYAESQEERALRKRIDWRLLPVMVLCYFLLSVNRFNVQLIYQERKQDPNYFQDPKFYAIVQFIFAISYSLPEPLWNVLLRLLSPRLWLAPALGLSGFLAVFCGVARDWQSIAGVRFLMGFPLGALFPGCMYFITCWYPRRSLGRPVSIFYSGAALGATLANIINAGMLTIDRKTSTWGSDWAVIMWGLITILAAVITFFVTPDFPDDDDRIIRSEEDLALFKRWYVADDITRNVSEHYRPHAWKQAFTDMKTLLFIIVRMSTVVGRDGLLSEQRDHVERFAEMLSNKSRHKISDPIKTLLYVPPVALAVVTTISLGILSDRIRQRGYIIMCTSWFSICAFIILVAKRDEVDNGNAVARYIAGFLGSIGTWAGAALSWAWMANNVEGLFKRAIVIGINVGTGNLIGGLTNPATGTLQGDNDRPSNYYLLGISCVHFVGIVVTRWYLNDQNRKKQTKREHRPSILSGSAGSDSSSAEDQGDKSPEFQYML